MLIYRLQKGVTILTKEGSFSTTCCSNCKHFLNFTCHTHKRNGGEEVGKKKGGRETEQEKEEILYLYIPTAKTNWLSRAVTLVA